MTVLAHPSRTDIDHATTSIDETVAVARGQLRIAAHAHRVRMQAWERHGLDIGAEPYPGVPEDHYRPAEPRTPGPVHWRYR